MIFLLLTVFEESRDYISQVVLVFISEDEVAEVPVIKNEVEMFACSDLVGYCCSFVECVGHYSDQHIQ